MMNKQGKYFLVFFFVVLALTVGLKYKQFVIDKNFTAEGNVPCDPATESCFRIICDGECDTSGVIVNADGSPYKKVNMHYSKMPRCLEEENCTSSEWCTESSLCEVTTCIPPTDQDPGNAEEDVEECIPMGGVEQDALPSKSPDIGGEESSNIN